MSIAKTAENMLFTPKIEWGVIANEERSATSTFSGYVLPFLILASISAFVGHTFLWRESFNETAALTWGIYFAIQIIVVGSLGVWFTAAIVNALAPSFGSERNMGRAMQLVAYAVTPALVGALLLFFPPLGIVTKVFGIYGLYILYLGFPKIMKTPQDKLALYFVVSTVILLVSYIVLGLLYKLILWDMIFGFFKNIEINQHPLK